MPKFNIISKRKYTYILSAILLIGSIASISIWGLKLGIDFQGGTLMEVQFTASEDASEGKVFEAPERSEIEDKLFELGLNSLTVQPTEGNSVLLRYIASNEDQNEKVLGKLGEFEGGVKQLRVDFVGSSISNDLQKSAIWAIVLAIIGIALYIAWAFRKVSRPIASWQYGFGAILALAHDIIITVGIFSILGKFLDVEIGVPFVAALLTILGYSVNDTIVVFDRTRENILKSSSKDDFENIVDKSLNESLARSINTSLTVIVVLLAIILFGGESIKYFSITLLIGVVFGTYSSMYVASALLVSNYKGEFNKINIIKSWKQKKQS